MVPKRLSDYPWVIVNLSCKLCARRGRYRAGALGSPLRARYGTRPGAGRPSLRLRLLAHEPAAVRPAVRGPGSRISTGYRRRTCRLSNLFSGSERRPARMCRSVARQPHLGRRIAHPMLSDWTAPHIVVVCEKCGRRESFDTEVIRAATVGDVRLTDLRSSLTVSCPRARAGAISDWCGARLEEDH